MRTARGSFEAKSAAARAAGLPKICKIWRNAAHNAAVGWTQVQFDNVAMNYGPYVPIDMNTATARLKVSEPGIYQIMAGWGVNGAANSHYGALYKNGLQTIVEAGEGVSMSPFRHMGDWVECQAGDEWSMQIFTSSTATTLLTGLNTLWLALKKEGGQY